MAAKGYISAQNGAGAKPKDVYFRIRAVALVEDILETAVRGGATGGSRLGSLAPSLKGATRARPTPRVTGGGMALDVTLRQGSRATVTKTFNISPNTSPALTEEEIVSLARHSLGASKADADPIFNLEAFLLYWYAGNKPQAKSAYDKLPPTEQQQGYAVFGPQLKGVTSQADEMKVKKLYEEGYELLVKKRDHAGAARKFRECMEKYSGTEYMTKKIPPGNKTRTTIIEGLLKLRR